MDYLIIFLLLSTLSMLIPFIAKRVQRQLSLNESGNRMRRRYLNNQRLLQTVIISLTTVLLLSSCIPRTNLAPQGSRTQSREEDDQGDYPEETTASSLIIETITTTLTDESAGNHEGQVSSIDTESSFANEIIESQEEDSSNIIESDLEVHFLDVGQGASVLFRQGDHTMILDGGDRSASSFVVAYLKKLGIKTVDVMIATHYDADHINGLVGVLNAFEVDVVYNADYIATTKIYSSYKSAVQTHADREIIPKIGQSFDLADMRVTFIAPKHYDHSDVNDSSISIRLDFGSSSFVIMGDQSANAEQQMLNNLNLDADVYYTSHHGSNGSNSKTLLAAVSPKWAVISVGADNSYGHPGQNTLNRIQNSGARLFRTDQQGTIIVRTDGKDYEWSNSPVNEASSPTTLAPKPTAAPALAADITYVLNSNTKKFHTAACQYAATIAEHNRVDSKDNRDSIIALEYEPCKSCKP